jgi:ubiquinone/menaquinone biosynthesis C-methylase UbiE
MQALFNVGFFEEMCKNGKVNVDSFTETKNLDNNILTAICDSLVALSILKKQSSDYMLDSKGRILVDVASGWFVGAYGYEEVFHYLEALLRKEKTYGKDIYRRPDFVCRGSGDIERLIYFPLAIDMIACDGFKNVLDLGCGDGTFLRNMCESNNELRGYGIDIAEEAIEEGKEKLKTANLQDRIQLFALDISKIETIPDPLEDIDVGITFFVLHELLFTSKDRVLKLLGSFRRMFPDVPLIVFEAIRATPDEMHEKPGMAVQYLLQHEITHQKLVYREEWKELFKTAGFRSIEERYLKFARTSIFFIR